MSDLKLIDKVAQRIYPSRLEEARTDSSFSWNTVLPSVAKHDLKDSVAHKESTDRNTHTLTHRMKNGASLEFNMTGSGKQHIALAKYQNKGKLFTAIHSHEDPYKAMATAYQSVKRRMVTEDVEPTLIEKVAQRIEKKTGKLSTKKEKIDVEPSEEKELKEGTIEVIPHFIGVMPDGRKVSPFSAGIHHVEKTGKWTWGVTDHNGNYTTGMSRRPVESREEATRIAHEVAAKTLFRVKLHESTPPGMESWVKKNKARFVKEYGEKKGHEVLYATAWKLHDKMNEMEELNEISKKTLASYIPKAASSLGRLDGTTQQINNKIQSLPDTNDLDAGESLYNAHKAFIKQRKKLGNKSAMRLQGIERATSKLAEAQAWKLHNKMNEMEELNESKFISNDGREFTTEKGRTEFYPEVHHVFHNGEHVGYVRQNEIQPYKKIAGSRLVKPLAKRKVWNFHLDQGHSLDGKSVKYRDSSGFGSKKAALESLAKHHKSSKLSEEELNELSKKTLASYVKKSNHSSFELGYDAASNEFHDDGDYKKTQKDEKKALKRQRFVSKAIDKLAEAEYPTDTKQGILAQLDYHHGRENYHRQSAEMSHRKAESSPFNSDSYRLHKSVAKGHEAVANHHSACIADLHKRFSQVAESEQLDELSPWTLGNYIRRAAIDKGSHAASQAIDNMSSYSAEDRGDKKEAEKKKKSAEEHGNKQTKRFNGIMRATDKLVHKAVVKEDSIEEAAHPDRIVMTSSIRKDLGGGYMAKTKNGHFYKLDAKALGEPGKGRELPKIGSVLDTSKHKFIGKDKVDLNLLKEHINESLIDEPHHVNSAKIVQNHPELNRIFNKQEALGNKLTVFRSDNGLHLYSYEAPNIKNRSKIYHSFIHDDNTGKSSEVARESGHEHSIHAAWKRYKKHLNEDLDHDHPDMKAYHAAVKARDEAHLASIRYRMNHDIKQPAHRAKYDELEAEHHRLRDIENLAAEKVHGRLFAHHVGFKE